MLPIGVEHGAAGRAYGLGLHSAQKNNPLLTLQWAMIFAPGLALAPLAVSVTLVNFGVDTLSRRRLRGMLIRHLSRARAVDIVL
jgi:ABC-type dipeptide/oligopeptide/nickel transport system permease subunit